jgi:hypothetical protein
MTTETADETDGGESTGRYGELEVAEEFVVYDRENHRAWLQSSVTVPVSDRR